jgi:hypothetical protein
MDILPETFPVNQRNLHGLDYFELGTSRTLTPPSSQLGIAILPPCLVISYDHSMRRLGDLRLDENLDQGVSGCRF